MLKGRPLTIFLLAAITLSVIVLIPAAFEFRLPGVDQGYEPAQPIAFSHRLHAGELEISCLYCHSGARKSRNAGVPSMSLCMNCHKTVSAPFMQVRQEAADAEKEKRGPRRLVSSEIRKIYRALGLKDDLKPDPSLTAAPVVWNRVHNLPDFVYFDHRPHVNAEVQCQACHGPAQSMERVRQFGELTMGWCVNCHRKAEVADSALTKPHHAATDCARCHY